MGLSDNRILKKERKVYQKTEAPTWGRSFGECTPWPILKMDFWLFNYSRKKDLNQDNF